MHDPSEPLRLKREGLALYLANGYGPSAAYSSAGYSFKSRTHLSKNAATLTTDKVVKSRVLWLEERPQEAASLLRQWNAQRNEAEAQERSQAPLRPLQSVRQIFSGAKCIHLLRPRCAQ